MQFNSRELATVLAALRYWKNDLDDPSLTEGFEEYFTDTARLSAEDIDDLCERINFDDAPPLVVVSGGTVQNADGPDFDLVDYDMFEDNSPGDQDNYWRSLTENGKRFVRRNDPEIAARFESEKQKQSKVKKQRREKQ
jgi:hypothetical protein